MRTSIPEQRRLDSNGIGNVPLNLDCRDEIVPILRALQHIYEQPELRDTIIELITRDVNRDTRNDRGRIGMGYWEIAVLAGVRLGCNLDFDKLQDLAEQHRTLRQIMGLGDWDDRTCFSYRRIHDNLCLLKPETIAKISQAIAGEGHRLVPEAVERTRADSFVAETNIHYPSESSLIRDGIRIVIELCVPLAVALGMPGWRQHKHLLKKIKVYSRRIERIAARKGPRYQTRLKKYYRRLLILSGEILERACALRDRGDGMRGLDTLVLSQLKELKTFIERTEHVRGTARRRVLQGETVPNEEKLFSVFETHTQLYKRGKAGEPIQFGRLVLIYEDGAGFITHHHILARNAQDRDVLVEQTRIVQDRLGGRIREASFDRGFHSPENQNQLAKIIESPCLPKPGVKQSQEQAAGASVDFHQARQRHSGIESAIGALQSGNGLDRCRDRTEIGFARYIALGVLGRNLHTLGRLLIVRDAPDCEAAISRRAKQAA